MPNKQSMTPVFTLHQGTKPLLVSIPHAGTAVPEDIACRFSDAGKALPDTDWHVDRLYDFALDTGASVLVANYSRYVIDLNRPADDEPLYIGQDTTGLIPIDTFEGEDIYFQDIAPDFAEIIARTEGYWAPYHGALQSELIRLRDLHGHAVLWDAHSIASQVPRLFEGSLPDFNFGTYGGATCDADLLSAIITRAEHASGYTTVSNGRFKGGYITRHYGHPERSIHAIQLELSQRTYMEETAPWPYRIDLAEKVRPHLQDFIKICADWQP